MTDPTIPATVALLDAIAALREAGRLSRELALVAGLDRHMVGRRATELARRGMIRRTMEYHGAELRLWLA